MMLDGFETPTDAERLLNLALAAKLERRSTRPPPVRPDERGVVTDWCLRSPSSASGSSSS